MSALTIYLKKIALAALWALTLALLVLSLGWIPLARASQKVVAPIYLGGPVQPGLIFALVPRRDRRRPRAEYDNFHGISPAAGNRAPPLML